MVLQIEGLGEGEGKGKFHLDAGKSKNIHLTSLVDRLIFGIKIDITKVNNPWIITDYENIITDGIFRYNKLFYQKGITGTCRRVFCNGVYGHYLIWDDEDIKVLSFKKYITNSTDYAGE